MKTSKISLFLLIVFLSQISQKAKAQIVPDNTLGSESSVVNSINELRSRIEGGATRGSNLFHSFEEFNVGEGFEVYFANPDGVANIFSRVTGNNISEILGTLGVHGNANLLFLNPNGIVFGENAFIDVGGSFIATTADRVEFADGKTFSGRDNNQKPLLTWNAPIGLGLNYYSGQIVVRGTGHNLLISPEGLYIPDNNLPSAKTEIFAGKGFGLLGNGIRFEGGVLDISAERIEIGSVEQGQVNFSLSPQLEFDYSQVEQFGNISLNDFSLININGNQAIQANLEGNLIQLDTGSVILFRKTEDVASNLEQAINIDAQDKLLLRGTTSENFSAPEGLTRGLSTIGSQNFVGDAIDINITSKDLIIESGGQLGILSLSEGLSGSVNINTSNSVSISGFLPSNPTLGLSGIATASLGNTESADININTKNLSITNGSSLGSITLDSGQGGDINIEVKESVLVDGFLNGDDFLRPSLISSTAFNNGRSGDIKIQTTDLFVLNGGVITTSSFSDATAGNIDITAANSILVDGFAEGEILDGLNAFSTITSLVSRLNPDLANNNPTLPTNPIPTGDAGSVFLNTNSLTVSNRGSVTVQNFGVGNAGTIKVKADSINLDGLGSISAAASSGIGGNIDLKVTDNLTLSDRSTISTSAGGLSRGGDITINADTISLNQSDINARSASGNGGNITLNADQIRILDNSNISASASGGDGNGGNVTTFSDTFLAGNSDVTATAVRGNGGNILIDSQVTIGLAEGTAKADDNLSRADASSEFGEDGDVTITSPQNSTTNPQYQVTNPKYAIVDPNFREDCIEKKLLEDLRHDNNPNSNEEFYSWENYRPDPDFVVPPEYVKKPQPEPTKIEDLVWKPGMPMIPANQLVTTEDGRLFLIPDWQAEELVRRQNGCSTTINREGN